MRLWTVKWQSAVLDIYAKADQLTGTLETVTGEIYNGEKVASTFKSDRSTVDKNKEVLVLEGHARVVSKQMDATMTCDRIRYDAAQKLIKAIGNVKVVGPAGTISGLQEVWTTPDLKVVATPDMFKR